LRIEKPYRRRLEGSIDVAADPDVVFALMCPVREYEWEPGWRTNLIISESGLAEEGCIFTTPGGASEGSDEKSADAVWVTPIHDAKTRRLMMIKVTPEETVMRLDIAVNAAPDGARVTTSYEYTALTDAGRRIVDRHVATNFDAMMKRWALSIERAAA